VCKPKDQGTSTLIEPSYNQSRGGELFKIGSEKRKVKNDPSAYDARKEGGREGNSVASSFWILFEVGRSRSTSLIHITRGRDSKN